MPDTLHDLDSIWLIASGKTHKQVPDDIRKVVDANDGVLVLDVAGDGWATTGLGAKVNAWLKKYVKA
jgi:hypothetical protein